MVNMQTKSLILLVGLFMILYPSFAQDLDKISKDIRNQQLSIEPEAKEYINRYYNLRKRTNILKEFFPVTENRNDTIFILERHGEDFSDSVLLSTVWNTGKRISYYSQNHGETFNLTEKYLFSNYMTKLVSDWNVVAIRKEDVEGANLTPTRYIFAIRIIFNGVKYRIDCLYFENFFNPEKEKRFNQAL